MLNDENGVYYGSTLISDHWKTLNVDFCFKLGIKEPYLRNFFVTDSCFNRVTSDVTALGWPEKKNEERKKMNNSEV